MQKRQEFGLGGVVQRTGLGQATGAEASLSDDDKIPARAHPTASSTRPTLLLSQFLFSSLAMSHGDHTRDPWCVQLARKVWKKVLRC